MTKRKPHQRGWLNKALKRGAIAAGKVVEGSSAADEVMTLADNLSRLIQE